MSSLQRVPVLSDTMQSSFGPKYAVLLGGVPHTPDLLTRADYLLRVLGAISDEHDGWQPIRPRRSPESLRPGRP